MSKRYTIALIILAVVTSLSLASNVVVIVGLVRARRIALDTVSDARAIVESVSDDTFSYTLEVDQEIPIEVSIPFREEVTVPINTTVPIDTTVVVPIELGVTSYDLSIPIHTVFPLDKEFTVPISQTMDVVTTVPLNVDVPISIPIRETPLNGYLETLDASLARRERQLKDPFGTLREAD